MKLLWFSPTPGLYGNGSSYNGGGWIASLQNAFKEYSDDNISIAIAFPSRTPISERQGIFTYYGMPIIKHQYFRYEHKMGLLSREMERIVDSEQPDAILCFGTEKEYGLIASLTKIPVFIHLQGVLNPYYETWLPQGMSWFDYLKNLSNFISWLGLRKFKEREIQIFKSCKYFLGRTEWDHNIVNLLAPQAKYYYSSEILRPEIYYSNKVWKKNDKKCSRIVSVISNSVYKGGDVILRTAKILHQHYDSNYEWIVYGVKGIKRWERLTGILGQDVNIKLGGIVDANELVEILTEADVYVHPSYIENSPNSVCEAQLLGIPTIATNVGGTNSLINHRETGMLVSANDPYNTASVIKELLENKNLCDTLSVNGRKIAKERHNPVSIVKQLIKAIESVINK